jgi:integral membrane sensor domain MASE1
VPGQLLENWYTWWQGDLTGIIVVTPFLLVWLGAHERRRPHTRPIEIGSFAALFSSPSPVIARLVGRHDRPS